MSGRIIQGLRASDCWRLWNNAGAWQHFLSRREGYRVIHNEITGLSKRYGELTPEETQVKMLSLWIEEADIREISKFEHFPKMTIGRICELYARIVVAHRDDNTFLKEESFTCPERT